jgi:hypothetical protein
MHNSSPAEISPGTSSKKKHSCRYLICATILSHHELQQIITLLREWYSSRPWALATLHPFFESIIVYFDRNTIDSPWSVAKDSKAKVKIDVIVFLCCIREETKACKPDVWHRIKTPERHAVVNTLAWVECKAKPPC